MSRIFTIFLLLVLSIDTFSDECSSVKLSPEALAIVKPLMELRIKQQQDQLADDGKWTDDGEWTGGSTYTPKVDELFNKILENKSPEGDEALVYFLNIYMGEASGEELTCEATNRGRRLLPLIKSFSNCVPKIGLEPLPKYVRGSGVLSKYAIDGINSGKPCVYEE